MPNRQLEAIRAFWESHDEGPWEPFLKKAETCEVLPVEFEGEIVGAVILDGPILHGAIKPHAFGKVTHQLMSHVEHGLKKHGYLVSPTKHENTRAIRYLENNGFHLHKQTATHRLYVRTLWAAY